MSDARPMRAHFVGGGSVDIDFKAITLSGEMRTKRHSELCQCGHPVTGRSEPFVAAAMREHQEFAHA